MRNLRSTSTGSSGGVEGSYEEGGSETSDASRARHQEEEDWLVKEEGETNAQVMFKSHAAEL